MEKGKAAFKHNSRSPFFRLFAKLLATATTVRYINDGHSGACSAATFSIYFSSPATSGSAAVFLAEKAATLQRPILSKFSAATVNELLSRLFHIFTLLFGVFVLRLFSLCSYHVILV